MHGSEPAEHLGYAKASSGERWWALLASLCLLGAAIYAFPRGQRVGPAFDGFVPAIGAAAFVALAVTSAILRNQYRAARFAPYAFLSTAYGAAAAVLVPYVILYPHAFSSNGFGTGPQTELWLWCELHGIFLGSLALYVWTLGFFQKVEVEDAISARVVRGYVVAAIAVVEAMVITTIVFHDRLPEIDNGHGFNPLFHLLSIQVLLGFCAVVLVALVLQTKLRDTTHVWLAVVLLVLAIEIYATIEFVHHTYTVAWYAAILAALAWQSLLLIAQLQHANEQMEAFGVQRLTLIEETLRDALTGLYNRRGFDDRFAEALDQSRLTGKPVGLIALDLDYFKSYNDQYGHLAGDEALRRIGTAIASVANRNEDTCCRIGGEEFAIVLPETDGAGTLTVAERVRAAVKRLKIPHAAASATGFITVSIGIAIGDAQTPRTAKELYEAADQQLYRAKRLGRDRIAMPLASAAPLEETDAASAQAG